MIISLNEMSNKEKTNVLPARIGEYYDATVPDTLDLAERAKLGLNHFTEMIEEKLDYEMYFSASFNYNPPIVAVDLTAPLIGCQSKALEAMAMLRIMSGSRQHIEREVKMAEMIASLQGDDGLFWVPIREDKPWMGKDIGVSEPYAHVGGQRCTFYSILAWYQYTQDPVWKKRLDKLVDGLDKLAVHKEDYAYFPIHGMCRTEGGYNASMYPKFSGWHSTEEPKTEKGGEEGSLFNHQGMLPGALANWYLLSGNEKSLRLAGEMVRFLTKPQFWGGIIECPGMTESEQRDYFQQFGIRKIQRPDYPGVSGKEHAHWWGHFHGHINVLRAILEYAIAVNNARLKSFVRDGYEWARHQWLARIGFVSVADGQGCALGRLIGLAVKLTYAGVGDYWEDVDQYIRNHGVEMQFNEEDIEYLLKVSEGKPAPPHAPPRNNPERVVERIIGGFANNPVKTESALCCSVFGNMGLYYAWDGTLRFSNGVARVNLLLNRASPWMDIDSYLPYEGKVVIRNKTAKEAFVRIPLWVNRKQVTCEINNRKVPPVWFDNNYLRFRELKEKDVITIKFPVVETTEKWTITMPVQAVPHYDDLIEKESVHTCKFRGNTLIEMSPPLPSLPPIPPITHIYKNRGHYRATKAPMKKVTRYVTNEVLRW